MNIPRMLIVTRLGGFQLQKIKLFQQLYPLIISQQPFSYLGNWEPPAGFDTGIWIYNSAANKNVPLVLKQKGIATWYMCGPTVYAESHIGHAACYVKFDTIRRILENVYNINVILLQGITDIDDKIIKKSNEAGICAFQLARKYELDFFNDMESLNVLPPTIICRVSENIPLIVSFCEKLIDTDFAYVTSEGNVYFKVCKGSTSDILNETPIELSQNTSSDALKKDPRDFALWKTSKPNEPSWESPWGKGRPGWHIECSAMASKFFGSQIDLHSGGYDLLFPHHANEKSQSEAYHGCSQWVNYWLHSGLLHVADDSKMSKSLGNTISIKDFLKEHCVNDFRILCVQSTYRKNLPYDCETLTDAKSKHKKLHNFINDCESFINGEIVGNVSNIEDLSSKLTITNEKVMEFLSDDFNTNQALLCVADLVDDVNKNLPLVYNVIQQTTPESISIVASSYLYVVNFLEMLGINIVTKKKLPREILFAVDAAILFRNKIRLLAMLHKDINLKQPEDVLLYLNEAYKFLNKELDMIYQLEECPKYVQEISRLCNILFQKAYKFVEEMDAEEKKQLCQDVRSKEIKKRMSSLFAMCDEFRSDIQQCGISIKDKGSSSLWIPLVEINKILAMKRSD